MFRAINSAKLIIDVRKIPVNWRGIKRNLCLLHRHAQYLKTVTDIKDPFTKGLVETAPLYICKQIERLRLLLKDEVDIVAWISRNLMELFFTLRYMYSSRERYDEVITEQLKDLKEIEELLYPNSMPPEDAPDEVKSFHSDTQILWEKLEEYKVKRGDLKRPQSVKHFAEGANLLHEYNRGWRIHSKYVHPTSYLLFGKKSFVYGKDARHFFWVMAQYYAAWNLRDLNEMVEAARAHEKIT